MMDIEKIRSYLPHRYPMLLVDRILELDPGRRAVGLKNVTINEDYFSGHFPGHAIMPGVLILEAMAQVGGVLVLSHPALQQCYPMLGGIESVRFRKPVVPGDTLVTEVELIYLRNRIGKVKVVGRVNGEIVASAQMTFGLVSPEDLEARTSHALDEE